MPFPKAARSLSALLLFILMAHSTTWAATWVLSNGDRLTGLLVSESEREILIEHAVLGRLTIARASLQGEVKESGAPGERSAHTDRGSPAATAVQATPGANTTPRFKWMNRQFELGYARQDGPREKEDLTFRLNGEARLGQNSFRGTAQLNRSEAERDLVVDRTEANLRWRHDFDKKLFAQSLTTYASDDVRKINLSLEQQVGGGYRLIDARRQQVNVGLGAVVQRLARDGHEDMTMLLGSAFQDYALQWNDRLRFTQEATFMMAEGNSISRLGGTSTVQAPDGGNYRLKLNAALQTKMTDKVSLLLRYEYDYDRSVSESIFRADSRLTTSLGYSW